jgi:prolyl oligopeptidase
MPARTAPLARAWTAAAAAVLLAAACTVPPPAPSTRSEAVTDRLHGVDVPDPYRWLEDVERPEVQAWLHAQAARTRSVLDRLPGRQALLERMLAAENGASARVSRVSLVADGKVFALKREAGAAQAKLVMRRALDGEDRVVVDPAQFGAGRAIDYFIPSPDGRFVAFGISEGGSEDAALYLRDTGSGEDLVGPVADAKFNGGSPYRWAADGSAVHFTTLRDRAGVAQRADLFQWTRTWRLAPRAGAQPELVADGLRRVGPALGPDEFMTVLRFGRSPWEVAYAEDGVRRDLRALVRRAGTSEWKPLIAHADAVWQFEVAGDRVYALTPRGAERFRVVATSVATPDWANAQVVLPEGRGVVKEIAAALDALYVVVREGAGDRLLRVRHDGGAPQEIALPRPGALRFAGHHADRPGVIVELSSWTEATQFHFAAPGATKLLATTLQPAGRDDRLDGVTTRVEDARSHDGTAVPLSIVERAGRSGPKPTIIVAYGAYGFSQEARLRSEWVPWLERGHAMATCHVRGGGEYGEAWYRAGRKQTKPNTWKDLIACAEHLVRTGVTTPRLLGIAGWSAGGITVGRAFTERPDLFAAAAPGVGVLDAVRAETEANGPANIAEFGTVKDASEFRALLAMSAYHHVRPGVRYPAVILPHGANDRRVAVWHSAKMAAALQAADPAAPVLLNVDFAAGHGRGSSAEQRLSTFADTLAFMLWRFGEPGFELR